MTRILACIVTLLACSIPALSAENYDDLLKSSREAADSGNLEKAIELASKAIETDLANPQGWYLRGLWQDQARKFPEAIADYNKALTVEKRSAQVYYKRGSAHFRVGNIKESITDFDMFAQLVPSQAPHQWQRGIALYYDGKYAQGRAQFELHQTVNIDDVENAVWHFLCVTKANGLDRAKELLINIQEDSRVPMMQIYALFAGRGTREDVLKTAQLGNPGPEQLKERLFYAHLYLGLYEEAFGNDKASLEHIRKAVHEYPQDHYMGDVARVHLKLREKDKK